MIQHYSDVYPEVRVPKIVSNVSIPVLNSTLKNFISVADFVGDGKPGTAINSDYYTNKYQNSQKDPLEAGRLIEHISGQSPPVA